MTIRFLSLLLISAAAGCNAAPGPAVVASKPSAGKSGSTPTTAKSTQPLAITAKPALVESPAKPPTKPPTKPEVEPPTKKEVAAEEPKLTKVVAQPPPPPKKEKQWKPTVAPQPPRPNFPAPATKFEFIPGPVGDLLRKEIGEGAPASLTAPRGSASPQRTGPSPAVQAAEKVVLPLPVSAYAYEGALQASERSKLPPSHPARDLPAIVLHREPVAPGEAVMPVLALSSGQIPPVPAALISGKSLDAKPTPQVDPSREPAFAATIKIAGADVIGPAPFQKITLPNPYERSEEVRLRSEPADSESPGILAGRIVERAVMPVPMPEMPKK